MDIGAILSEAWSLYTRFFVRFIVVAGVVFLALGAVSAIIEGATGEEGSLLASLLSLAVQIVGYFWIQGVLVVLTADVRDGVADHSFGELFARVRPKLGALILAGILAGDRHRDRLHPADHPRALPPHPLVDDRPGDRDRGPVGRRVVQSLARSSCGAGPGRSSGCWCCCS